jgi:O-antigen ligase
VTKALEAALAAGLYLHAASLPLSVAGLQIGAAVALVAALILRAPRRTPLDAPLPAFFAVAALSVALSSAPPGRAGLERLLPLAGFFAVAWGVGAAKDPAARALRLFAVMLAASATGGAVALVQHFSGFDPAHVFAKVPELQPAAQAERRFYAAGMFGSRLQHAHVLALAAAFAAGLAAARPLSRRALVLGGAAVVAALSGVWAAFARGAFFGVAAGAAVASAGRRTARIAAAAALGVALLAATLHPATRARLASAFDPSANSDRVQIWRTALAVAAEHPWLGVGFGRYPQVALARPDPPPNPDWAHNQALTLLAEMGAPGLLAGLWVAAAALWALFRRYRNAADARDRALAMGALAASAALLVIAQFHDPLFQIPVAYAASFFAGLALWRAPQPGPPAV